MPAEPDIPTVETHPEPSLPATMLCALAAIPIALLGLLAAVYMLLANMNLTFTRTIHIPIFLTGWSLVLACVLAAYRLIRRPAYTSLLTLIPVGILFLLLQWLLTFPESRGLLH